MRLHETCVKESFISMNECNVHDVRPCLGLTCDNLHQQDYEAHQVERPTVSFCAWIERQNQIFIRFYGVLFYNVMNERIVADMILRSGWVGGHPFHLVIVLVGTWMDLMQEGRSFVNVHSSSFDQLLAGYVSPFLVSLQVQCLIIFVKLYKLLNLENFSG